ncbi:MAG: NAD(P)H-quinone oxidoreductase [Actinobacteria bacterium]|nr:NAD(P)H-quinone oxidoreductase [Actinomycetota bacterium]
MRAVVVTQAGGPEVMRVTDVPDPVPEPGEILLRVRATAVNRGDIMQRRGLYPPPPGVSDILGIEAVGEVLDVTPGTETDLAAGDRVMCLVGGGAYAQLLVVPAVHCIRLPDDMPWDAAAAIPEVFITAFQALVRLGNLQPGEVALVHSIASGVGTAAAQICRAIGARCIGTSRATDRARAGEPHGAEALVVGDAGFADPVLEMTDGRGADVILDLVGAKYLHDNVACLARQGRIVLTGLVGGRRADLDMGALLSRQGTIIGSTLRWRTTAEKAEIMGEFAHWAMPLFGRGILSPVIDRVMALDDVARAHARVEGDAAVGKVVLLVD